ncbi:MAG: lipid A export permease/ATP-binding protein MsbA [Desulfobacterales bacterium]|nr:lipid A export permease/ATP-binding protein MsbA [Desulfobacterales bacterium]
MKSKKFFTERHRQIFVMIKHSWRRLAVAMACMIVVAATSSATAYMVKPVMDDIFVNQDTSKLQLIPILVVLLFFFRGLAYYGQEYLMNYVGEGVIRKFRENLYNHIQDLPLSFFHREKTGVLMSRITNDVNIVKSMVSNAVTSLLRDCFTIIGLTGVIFYMDWKMAMFAFLVLPVAFLPIVHFGRKIRKVSTGCQETMAEMNSFLHETFFGNKIVKAFGMEHHEKKRFAKKNEHLFNLTMKSAIVRSLSSPVMEFLGGLGIAFIIWFGGSRVMAGTSTPGTFMAFLTAVLMLYDPVKKLSHLNNAVQEGLASADRIFDILETKSDIIELPDAKVLKHENHRVAFKNVSLRYDKDMVLKNINLDVKPGEIVALVGMSGGGKTSMVNLIPRFYDVTDGAITIDGIDIRELTVKSLRSQIAIVTQDTILFNDTIRNNIAYGNQDASEEEIMQAAKAAYAYDFVQHFSDGFDTVIGELGGRLSGGEKQRICIARALIKDTPILILDEATSALDTEAEMLVQKALENLMTGRTTFVIAHRLSTISYAHRVLVMVGGKIVEEGTHEELLELKGQYYKLVEMQFGDGEMVVS